MKYLFLEANDLGQWLGPHGIHECFGDLGMGLLVTIAKEHGYQVDTLSLKQLHSWAELRMRLKPYDVLIMNVRSWRYRWAKRAAEIAKAVRSDIQVWVGGFHCTVALHEMQEIPEFDVIVSGEGEGTFLNLLQSGGEYGHDRILEGHVRPYENIDDLPFVDRSLLPRPPGESWPLEAPGGWGPGKKAISMLTGRMCPWRCHFCWPAEKNHFRRLRRRSVGNILEELKYADKTWGPATSVIYHDSEFLMQKAWLEEFVERYPRETPNWSWWASCRSDQMVKWPELTEALIREANWHIISLGIESGSDKVLKILNKEITVEQHEQAIEMVNRIGDNMQSKGQTPPIIFANVMLGIPGEQPEDAFETIRLIAKIKRLLPSISLFTPYPGNVLGDRIIAEGRSLDTHKRYDRFPNEAKMTGIDYQFYADLMNGGYDKEVGVPMRAIMGAQGTAGINVGEGM